MRRTRFVCISDTHGYTPSEAGFKLPLGDVLIHAGDLSNNGTMTELERTIDWISKADYEIKIVVAGNHDISLDPSLYNTHGSIHSQNPEDKQKCLDLVTATSPSIVSLTHQSAVIRLTRPDGPRTIFKVFGSPYSPRMSDSFKAFTYAADDADKQWSQIPADSDVVVTHTPSYSHLDKRSDRKNTGCKFLRGDLKRVRPFLSVCGHAHESRGFERVSWSSDIEAEDHVVQGVLPPSESKKQSLVDLAGKKGRKLNNHGCSFPPFPFPQSQNVMILPSEQPIEPGTSHEDRQSPGKETCIVNAAIMATSWPHQGGKKFNAPVVVDLDLPAAED